MYRLSMVLTCFTLLSMTQILYHYHARLREFIWVVRHWHKYYNVIDGMHNEWFDIDVGIMSYMSDPDNLYCKWCGCKYVPYTDVLDDRQFIDLCEQTRQQHTPTCPWCDIKKLRSCWYG